MTSAQSGFADDRREGFSLPPLPREENPARTTISWCDLATDDADQPAAMQRRWMTVQYDQVDRGAFAGRFKELVVDGITIVSEQHNCTVLKRQYTPPESCSVGVIRTISKPGRCDFDSFVTGTVGYAPGGRDYETLMPSSDIVFFQFDHVKIMKAAEVLGCGVPGDGRDALFVNDLEPGTLLGLGDTLLSSLGNCSSETHGELSPGYVGQSVMSHLIEVFAKTSGRRRNAYSPNIHRTVRAAQVLIIDAQEPLTVMDLCRELKVSRATLQRCFEHAYGIPPLMYLRMHRLNAARRALIAANGTAATVTSIAIKWGFFHLARFAKDYREQFGELPSTTLGNTQAGRCRPTRQIA
jgi:AraC family ethanolamine operon transcriptional activator